MIKYLELKKGKLYYLAILEHLSHPVSIVNDMRGLY